MRCNGSAIRMRYVFDIGEVGCTTDSCGEKVMAERSTYSIWSFFFIQWNLVLMYVIGIECRTAESRYLAWLNPYFGIVLCFHRKCNNVQKVFHSKNLNEFKYICAQRVMRSNDFEKLKMIFLLCSNKDHNNISNSNYNVVFNSRYKTMRECFCYRKLILNCSRGIRSSWMAHLNNFLFFSRHNLAAIHIVSSTSKLWIFYGGKK